MAPQTTQYKSDLHKLFSEPHIALVNADDFDPEFRQLQNRCERFGIKGQRFGLFYCAEQVRGIIGDQIMRQMECNVHNLYFTLFWSLYFLI